MQRLLLADGAVFYELLLSKELKFKLLERKLEKLLGSIKPNFMSFSYYCLMSKITLKNHTVELAQWAVLHPAWIWACTLAAKGMAALSPQSDCFRGKRLWYLVLFQSGIRSQALIWKKSISKKPWFSETCLGITVTHPCAMADLCHQPSDDICISFLPYLWCLLSPTDCHVTSRHSTSVLQGVHGIEYHGLNSPYGSLKENSLLFSPYSSLGGALNDSFYNTFLCERKMHTAWMQYALVCNARQFHTCQDGPKAQKGKENI